MAPVQKPARELPIKAFASPLLFHQWLEREHARSQGIWLRFFKKDSGVKTIIYQEALDEALAFGWIDSQVKKYDKESYLQRFSPRRKGSVWSKINVGKAQALIKAGRMKEAGLREVEAAKKDGRWQRAYASPSQATIPRDLQLIINREPRLKAFVETLNRSNINAISFRLSTAKKPETRLRRMEVILKLLRLGKKLI